MNEQIKELATEARLLTGWPRQAVGEVEYQKFAELIVEKCAAIIESQDVDPSFKLRMSWAVRAYFGVEE